MSKMASNVRTYVRGIFQYVDLTAPKVAAGKNYSIWGMDSAKDFGAVWIPWSSLNITRLSKQSSHLSRRGDLQIFHGAQQNHYFPE